VGQGWILTKASQRIGVATKYCAIYAFREESSGVGEFLCENYSIAWQDLVFAKLNFRQDMIAKYQGLKRFLDLVLFSLLRKIFREKNIFSRNSIEFSQKLNIRFLLTYVISLLLREFNSCMLNVRAFNTVNIIIWSVEPQ
jgi:hypothetical protein